MVRCDSSGSVAICRLDVASVVKCDPSGDTACALNVFAPDKGTCAMTPTAKGTVCDDGDVCTSGDLCEAGVCRAGPGNLCGCKVDGDCKDDGDLCNGVAFCDQATLPWTCRPKPKSAIVCDTSADGACVETACDPVSGACKSGDRAKGSACDDGDPCTAGDACEDGSCKGSTNTCTCNKDSDCADGDGDLCTGVPYCDKSGAKPVCQTNPATIVVCSTVADTDCRKNVCDKSLGSCKLTSVVDKSACDDGDA